MKSPTVIAFRRTAVWVLGFTALISPNGWLAQAAAPRPACLDPIFKIPGLQEHVLRVSDCTVHFQAPDGSIRAVRAGEEPMPVNGIERDRPAPEFFKTPQLSPAATLQLSPVSLLEGTVGDLEHVVARTATVNAPGIDIDSDSQREIVLQTNNFGFVQNAQIFESVAGNVFEGLTTEIFGIPEAVGDSDSDGLKEIVTGEFDHGSFRAIIQVREQPDKLTYPSVETVQLIAPESRCACPPVNIAVDDLDGDRRNEIIYAITEPGFLSINEATGDNTYQQKYLASRPEFLLQRMLITVDLDNNGRKEALVSGVPYMILYEPWGNDAYRPVWWSAKQRNTVSLAYVGDSDGDGRKEFLVGSIDVAFPGFERCTLYEYDGAGGFNITWEVSGPSNPFSDPGPTVEAADFDGDGNRELLCSRRVFQTFALQVYESTGDNEYALAYSSAGVTGDGLGLEEAIGVGDFDRDNRIELVLNENRGGAGPVVAVYESDNSIDSNVLRLTAGYQVPRFALDFTIGTPARNSLRWYTALYLPSAPEPWIALADIPLPPILPSRDFAMSFPFPRIGWVGVYTALISDEGTEVSRFRWVLTGAAAVEGATLPPEFIDQLPGREDFVAELAR